MRPKKRITKKSKKKIIKKFNYNRMKIDSFSYLYYTDSYKQIKRLSLVFTYHKYSYLVQAYEDTKIADVDISMNSIQYHSLYKCRGKCIITHTITDKKEEVISFTIFFYDDIDKNCIKVVYIKFPTMMKSGSNIASNYLLFKVVNMKREREKKAT